MLIQRLNTQPSHLPTVSHTQKTCKKRKVCRVFNIFPHIPCQILLNLAWQHRKDCYGCMILVHFDEWLKIGMVKLGNGQILEWCFTSPKNIFIWFFLVIRLYLFVKTIRNHCGMFFLSILKTISYQFDHSSF